MHILIAGVDPGINTGIALMDFKGNVIKLETVKKKRSAEIAKEILKYGEVIVISSDRKRVSSTVKKLASFTGAHVILPTNDLTKKRKKSLVKHMLKMKKIKKMKMSSHEFDALASATFAYKKLIPSIKKLRDKLIKYRMEERLEEAIEKMLKSNNFRISDFIKLKGR